MPNYPIYHRTEDQWTDQPYHNNNMMPKQQIPKAVMGYLITVCPQKMTFPVGLEKYPDDHIIPNIFLHP